MNCSRAIKTYGPRYWAFCLLLFLIAFLGFLLATSLNAKETCILETGLMDDDYYEAGPDNFSITVESLGGNGNTVQDVGVFRINRATLDQGLFYTLVFFLDHQAISAKKGLKPPVTLRYSFKGLKEGMHDISFQLIDGKGRTGTRGMRINVVH
jgi:hypothetical protein